jgi:hypothetical protein
MKALHYAQRERVVEQQLVDRALRGAMLISTRLCRHYLASSDGALDPPLQTKGIRN